MKNRSPFEKCNSVHQTKTWQGRCGDSFCYSSCYNPHCRVDMRLGVTPTEHNSKIAEIHKERADRLCEIYALDKGSELYDDIHFLFQRLSTIKI